MKLLNKFSEISKIDINIIYMLIFTIITTIIIHLLSTITCKLISKIGKNNRRDFIIIKRVKIAFNIILLIIVLNIWQTYISDFITFISFFSAGVAIALRDYIFNFFCGIYIKANHPFKLEDRIEIGGNLGDVIDIRTLSFSLLEIDNTIPNGQSTGVIIHCPNSLVFTNPVRNLTQGFKYIWNEISLNIPLDSDVRKTKSILYRILKQNEILKRIPHKMENAIEQASTEYRIYFNNLEPIIYTKINNDHITLEARYLVHPKKARNVEDMIYNAIIEANKKGELKLFIND